MTQQRILLKLIYLSMLTVVIDGLIGFDIFINITSRFGFVLTIIWVFKVGLVSPLAPRGIGMLLATPFYLILTPFLLMNLFRGLIEMRNMNALLSGGFFYVLIIFGGAAGAVWSRLTRQGKQIRLSSSYVQLSAVALIVICAIYFILYVSHYIDYFGLGVQAYIVTAAILADGSTRLLLLPIVATILTGKRGLLVILIAQYSQMFGPFIRKNGFVSLLVMGGGLFVIGLTAYNFDLLDRFKAVFEVSWIDILDYTDPDALQRLYLATSGRSNEIFDFLGEISTEGINFWIGFPIDFSFQLIDFSTGETINHHYFHVSPFNFMKHFGVVVAIYILIMQIKVVVYCIRNGINQKDIGLLLYVGYFFAMFFGAIVMIDILYWVTFSYGYFQMRNAN